MNASSPSGASEASAEVLVEIARRAIENRLQTSAVPPPAASPSPAWLSRPAATFVTLELDGRLRGCIGSLEARRSLADDVRSNAEAAAFDDPRFPPLTEPELEGLRIEVSVLSKPEAMPCSSESALLASLRPGIDGLVLECGSHRSTFLPQVWESLGEPGDFVAALKEKARLPRDFWSDEMRFYRYTVDKFTADSIV